MEQLHGILIIDKPGGMSSAQCVGRIKRLGQKKIGHAGTLDPMATGVLIVLLGHATKLSGYLLEGGEKRYEGVARLGLVTDTWDAEGRTLEERPVPSADSVEGRALEDAVRREVAAWTEVTEQPVPPYSAAKHQGAASVPAGPRGKGSPAENKGHTYFARCASIGEAAGRAFPGRLQFRFLHTVSGPQLGDAFGVRSRAYGADPDCTATRSDWTTLIIWMPYSLNRRPCPAGYCPCPPLCPTGPSAR